MAMTMKNIIEELQKLGFEVTARKRTDGGYIITKINGMTFSGAKGNAYARQVLGVSLSQARIEQMSYNVTKYISSTKKTKTLDEGMKKKLRKVQKIWRENEVGGGARITAKKVKRHLRENGVSETEEYLRKMERYGEGYAYEENVEYLAQYIEDMAKGIVSNDNLQNRLYELAEYIRSRAGTFKEEWIKRIYQAAYIVIEFGYNEDAVERFITGTYSIIG